MPPVTGPASNLLARPRRRADRPSPGHPVSVTGVHGSVRWGYHVAATIRDWTVTRTRKGSTLTGGVVTFNRYQTEPVRPGGKPRNELFFVALIKGGAWQWPVRRIEIDARTVRAELGPQLT